MEDGKVVGLILSEVAKNLSVDISTVKLFYTTGCVARCSYPTDRQWPTKKINRCCKNTDFGYCC